MDFSAYLQSVGEWLLTSGLQIVLILVLMLIGLKLAKVVAERMFRPFQKDADDTEMKKRTDTLSSVIRFVFNIVIVAVALLMIMNEFGIDVGPVLAAAGVVGLAVGFGAQNLVKDIISGFFILLQDQIRVGDVVEIAGKGGLVEKLNLKVTVLRDLAGNVHYVSNGEISVVTNMTKDFSYYVFDVGVAYREDVDQVMDVLRQLDEEMRSDEAFGDDILEPIEIFGVDQFADSAVIIKARTKTRPIKQWSVAREFNRRMKKKFDELNIEIPFPHVTIYMGEDKKGKAPSLHVAMDGNGEAPEHKGNG